MTKEVLEIQKEYELLSAPAKKAWDKIYDEIIRIAEEMNLSASQTHALLQRNMAEARYADLKATNEYLSRTNEEYSQRAINRNKLEMQRMKRVHGDHLKEVNDILPQFNAELNKALNQTKTKKQ